MQRIKKINIPDELLARPQITAHGLLLTTQNGFWLHDKNQLRFLSQFEGRLFSVFFDRRHEVPTGYTIYPPACTANHITFGENIDGNMRIKRMSYDGKTMWHFNMIGHRGEQVISSGADDGVLVIYALPESPVANAILKLDQFGKLLWSVIVGQIQGVCGPSNHGDIFVTAWTDIQDYLYQICADGTVVILVTFPLRSDSGQSFAQGLLKDAYIPTLRTVSICMDENNQLYLGSKILASKALLQIFDSKPRGTALMVAKQAFNTEFSGDLMVSGNGVYLAWRGFDQFYRAKLNALQSVDTISPPNGMFISGLAPLLFSDGTLYCVYGSTSRNRVVVVYRPNGDFTEIAKFSGTLLEIFYYEKHIYAIEKMTQRKFALHIFDPKKDCSYAEESNSKAAHPMGTPEATGIGDILPYILTPELLVTHTSLVRTDKNGMLHDIMDDLQNMNRAHRTPDVIFKEEFWIATTKVAVSIRVVAAIAVGNITTEHMFDFGVEYAIAAVTLATGETVQAITLESDSGCQIAKRLKSATTTGVLALETECTLLANALQSTEFGLLEVHLTDDTVVFILPVQKHE